MKKTGELQVSGRILIIPGNGVLMNYLPGDKLRNRIGIVSGCIYLHVRTSEKEYTAPGADRAPVIVIIAFIVQPYAANIIFRRIIDGIEFKRFVIELTFIHPIVRKHLNADENKHEKK